MEQMILKQEYLDKVKTDGILFGMVANALNIDPASLPRLLRSNHKKLTYINVAKTIATYLHVSQDELYSIENAKAVA